MLSLFSQKYNRTVATDSECVKHYYSTQLQILQQENKENSFTKTNQVKTLNFDQQMFWNSVCSHHFSEKKLFALFFPSWNKCSTSSPCHGLVIHHSHNWKSFRAHCSWSLWDHQLLFYTWIQSSADWIQLNPIWQTAGLCCLALKQTLIWRVLESLPSPQALSLQFQGWGYAVHWAQAAAPGTKLAPVARIFPSRGTTVK